MRRAALALAALCLLSQRAAAQGGVEDDAVDQLPELDVQGNLTMYSGEGGAPTHMHTPQRLFVGLEAAKRSLPVPGVDTAQTHLAGGRPTRRRRRLQCCGTRRLACEPPHASCAAAGYLPVRVSPKTDLFYTVVYAEVPDPGQAPLIVWLGGCAARSLHAYAPPCSAPGLH